MTTKSKTAPAEEPANARTAQQRQQDQLQPTQIQDPVAADRTPVLGDEYANDEVVLRAVKSHDDLVEGQLVGSSLPLDARTQALLTSGYFEVVKGDVPGPAVTQAEGQVGQPATLILPPDAEPDAERDAR